jgi:anti-sigma-K factor RskA
MNTAHVIDNLPAYALGDLEGEELLEVARHLPGCPQCRAALQAYWRVADELPQALPPGKPPADLRARVVARVGAASAGLPEPAAKPERVRVGPARGANWMQRLGHLFWPKAALAGLGLVLVVALITTVAFFVRQGTPAAPAPQNVRVVQLAGDASTPEATGYLMVFPGENHGSLTVDKAPTLEPGFQYQVWLVKDGQRVSGGVFSVNADGYGVLQISADRPLDAFDRVGVTVEPAGGSPGPTGARLLGGDL